MNIEQRLESIERKLNILIQALSDDDEYTLPLTLDGEEYTGQRDETQSLG